MASTFRKKQKTRIIVLIALCALVLAAIALAVVFSIIRVNSLYSRFADKNFADALKTAYGYQSHYDIKQENLDSVEGLVYFCQIGMSNDNNNYASYAYPVVLLCDKTYTDLLIEQSDPGYEISDEEKDKDYSDHYKVCNIALSDPEDLNKFRNLRLLRAFDSAELNSMYQNAYSTLIYSYYGMADAVEYNQVLSALKLTKLTSLKQISGLTKLEHLSLDYSGITTLEGIEQFPNLAKLDLSNTDITDLNGLSQASGLTYLGLDSMHVTAAAAQPDHDEESGKETESTEESGSEKEGGEAESEQEEKEKTFNTSGLGNDVLAEIAKLKNLRFLDVANNNLSDLSGLAELTGIEYLYVGNNPLTSLKGVEKMAGLKTFYASDCNLTDASALSGSVKLKAVHLDNNNLTSLNGLEKAVEITTLHADGNQLADAAPVSGMTGLESLDLSDNKLTKLPDLSKLTCVTSLNFSDNEIADATGLASFDPSVYELGEDETLSVSLNLSKNKLKDLTLKAGKLTSLDVSENELESLKLNGCSELKTLTASKNKDLSSLEGLSTLKALTSITAEECAVRSMDSVKELENLTTVTMDGCELEDLSAFEENASITTLTLKNAKNLASISGLHTLSKLATANFTGCTGLNDEAVTAAFGTKESLVFAEDSALNLTLTGCTGITNYEIFDSYGSMKVTHDTTEKE